MRIPEVVNPRALLAIIIFTALVAGIAGLLIGQVLDQRAAPTVGGQTSSWWIVSTSAPALNARAFFLGPYVTHGSCDPSRGLLRVQGECRYATIQNLQRQRGREWWGVATLRYAPESNPIDELITRQYEIGRAGPYPMEQACANALAGLEKATLDPVTRFRSPFVAIIDRSECLPQRVSF